MLKNKEKCYKIHNSYIYKNYKEELILKELVLKIGLSILRIIYVPMKLLRTKNKVVYISRQFNNPTLDFQLIKEAIEKIDSNIENVMLTKRIEKGFKNSVLYVFHIFKQMYHIATSKIVVVDTYCIAVSVLKHKKETKIIQIWHALGAIKKFGYQTINKTSGASERIAKTMSMHKNYDYVLTSSPITKDIYLDAFNITEKQIKYIALPRVDYILQKKDAEKIYELYPELRTKINVLYVPTFRKGKKIQINKIIENFDTQKYNLIIKLHPLDKKQYNYQQKEGVFYIDQFTSYDLLEVADRIITDYSSLAIETSLLDKPIYFYTYDIKTYQEDPGLNFKFEEEKIGKYMAIKAEELLDLLEQDYDYSILEDFRNRYITVNTNNCAKQLAKFILEIMEDYEYKEESKEEPNTASKEKLTI